MAHEKKVSTFGTKDGKPAIEWWRYGMAVKGEPSIVREVTTYETVRERDAVLLHEEKV